MVKLLLIPIVAYLAIVVLMYLGQRSMLYLPGNRAATGSELDAFGLRRWPDGEHYRGYLRDTPDAHVTVVVFHGNAGDAIDRRYYLDALSFLNARILLAEYPGYGARPGKPSETVLLGDARETLVRLRDAYPDKPLIVIGESLGAAVAAGAVAEGAGTSTGTARAPLVDAFLLLTPWNSLTDLASHHYRWLPVRWLLKDRYPSDERLANVPQRKVVVIAKRDEVVPAVFGRALFDALSEPKELVELDARHNDWFDYVDRSWWRSVWSALVVKLP